jgi:hypothetical protein
MLVVAGINAFERHYWTTTAFVGAAAYLAVVHIIRVRRFKRFDQARTFD